MSRKVWIILLSSTFALLLALAAGVTAFIIIPRYRASQSLITARKLVSEGAPERARRPYKEYLYKNGEDIAVLEEYVGVCESVVVDRRRVLSDAGRVLARLVELEPNKPERKTQLLSFYRKYRFWMELESATIIYGGNDLSAMPPELAYDRIVAVQEQGRLDDAIVAFKTYIDAGHDPRDIPLREARVYAQQRDLASADGVFPPLLEKYPDNGALRIGYAIYLEEQNRLDESAAQLAKVSAADQESESYAVAAVQLATEREDYDLALATAEKALGTYPQSTDIQYHYIIAMSRAGKRDQVIDFIGKMAPPDRVDSPGFIIHLAEMHLAGGNLDGAEAARKMYADAYPDQRSIDLYLAGRIFFAKKAYADARDKFKIAAEMNPGLYRASFYLALCEIELGDKTKARTPLEQYLRNNPGDQQARRLWTRNYDTEPSATELQARGNRLLTESAPDISNIIFTIEDLLKHPMDIEPDLAPRLMDRAIALAPRDPRGYRVLVGYHLENGELDKAQAVLDSSAAAGVEQSSLDQLRAGLLLIKGDKDAAVAIARTHLEKASADERQSWAQFFAQQGYYHEGDSFLSESDGNTGTDSERVDDPMFRLSLALQFGTLDDAQARLAEAETLFGGKKEHVAELNKLRLALAEGLAQFSRDLPVSELENLLARVRENDPDNAGAKIVDALILRRPPRQKFNEANKILATIPEESDVYLKSLQIRAEIATDQGLLQEAQKLAETILERDSRNNRVMHLLANAQLGLNDLAGAQATLERILANDRYDLLAMRTLVRVYVEGNLPARANEMFQRFDKAGRNQAGQNEKALKDHDAQVEELRKVLLRQSSKPAVASGTPVSQSPSVSPPDAGAAPDASTVASAYTNMTAEVTALLDQKLYAEAVKKVEAFINEDPENEKRPELLVFLGRVILAQGAGADLRAASTAFVRATMVSQDYGPAVLGQIEVQVRGNNLATAISLSESYLQKHERDVEVMFRLATLLAYDPDRYNDALDRVTKAIEIEARPDFIRFRGYLLTLLERYDEAITEMNRVVQLAGSATADDELTLAEACLGKKDFVAAREHISAAEKLIPKDDDRLPIRLKQLQEKLNAGGTN